MSQLNRVHRAKSTSEYVESTVHFFGWDQKRNGLTDDLGQPAGEMHEMTLDSMTHAIVMNKGEFNPYTIKIGLLASFQEYIFILNLPRIVFVARYNASGFRGIIPENLRQEINTLSGRMNAKVHGIDGKDAPHELGPREGSELVIYYPAVMLNSSKGEVPHYEMPNLEHTFKPSAVRLTTCSYPPRKCTLVIELGNTGDPATEA